MLCHGTPPGAETQDSTAVPPSSELIFILCGGDMIELVPLRLPWNSPCFTGCAPLWGRARTQALWLWRTCAGSCLLPPGPFVPPAAQGTPWQHPQAQQWALAVPRSEAVFPQSQGNNCLSTTRPDAQASAGRDSTGPQACPGLARATRSPDSDPGVTSARGLFSLTPPAREASRPPGV